MTAAEAARRVAANPIQTFVRTLGRSTLSAVRTVGGVGSSPCAASPRP
jgi:hypothetical protein